MRPHTILVSDATRNPGLALIRELGRAGFDVRGADSRRLPLSLHSRYSPAYLTYGSLFDRQAPETLIDIVGTLRPEAFLPVSTTTTQAVSKNRELFESLTNVNVPQYEAFLTALDNERTLRTCARLGIPSPRIMDRKEAAEILSRQGNSMAGERVVIKPRMDLGAARGVHYASTRKELEDGIDANAHRYGDSVVQEFIPGDDSTMRLVLLLFDRAGKLLAYLTAQKILQWPPDGGLATVAASTHEPELVRLVLPFFEHLGWQGPAEVELKCDPRDGAPKVIEINPRVPSYMGFPERCEIPFTTMLVDAARNEWSGPICPSYPAGVRFLRTGELLKSVLYRRRESPHKAETVSRAWSEIRAGARPASRDLTDPLPRIGKLLREITDIVSASASSAAMTSPD